MNAKDEDKKVNSLNKGKCFGHSSDEPCFCGAHAHHTEAHATEAADLSEDGACGHSCGCGHCHGGGDGDESLGIWWIAAAFAVALLARFACPEELKVYAYALALVLAGWKVALKAVKNIMGGDLFDENFLMAVASIGAFAVGEEPEAIAVMIFYGIGEALEDAAVAKSRRNIIGLMDLRSNAACVLRGGAEVSVRPEDVGVGECVVVRAGEKIPLDGVVVGGEGNLDTKSLTGESLPRRVSAGSSVLAGCVSIDGVLRIRVEKPFADSAVSKILRLVEENARKKPKVEKFITRFARIYTPAVVGAALLVGVVPPLAGFGGWSEWIYRALCFLIISCPCALVLSIPLGFFAGMGGCARRGVLIKGGAALENLASAGVVAFDKTGTLTRGKFAVHGVFPASGVEESELLKFAGIAESGSNHPIAKCVAAYAGVSAENSDIVRRELSGMGVEVRGGFGCVLAGNIKLMKRANVAVQTVGSADFASVYVALNGKFLGFISVADTPREGIRAALESIRKTGVSTLAMLTGDSRKAAEAVAKFAGIDKCRSELLPQDKVSEIEAMRANSGGGKLVFIGDGINDAPSLMAADVGLAMGGIGSDAALEAADGAVMGDDISKVASAILVAKKTMAVVRENIVFSIGFKFGVMALALCGFASVWLAIFADVGVALLAVVNSLRAFGVGKR